MNNIYLKINNLLKNKVADLTTRPVSYFLFYRRHTSTFFRKVAKKANKRTIEKVKPWSKIVEDSKERIHTFTNKPDKNNENTNNADSNTSNTDAVTVTASVNIFQKNKTKLQNLYETKPGAVKIGTSLIVAALLLILLSTALLLKPDTNFTENIAVAPDATAANTAPVDEAFVTANTEMFLSSIGMLLTK